MSPSENGWPIRRLEDVAEIASGVAKGRHLDGATVLVPYLRVANVQAGHLDLSEIKEIEVLPSEVDKYHLQVGDILMTEGGDRDKLGRGTVWRGQIAPCIHQNHVFRVRPQAGHLVPEFLNYYMLTSAARTYFLRCAKQTTGIASINRTQLSGLPVPLPPVGEQKRIATILEKAESIRRKRREARRIATDLAPAIYNEMFGDPITNPKQWPTEPLYQHVEIVSGGTPSKARADYWRGSIPWVSPKDMKVPYLSDSQDHVSSLALEETTLKLIPKESVLVVVRGMIMAHTIPVVQNVVEVTINQDMKALLPGKQLCPNYLLWCLKAAHRLLLSKVSNAGHGTKRLAVEALADFRIPLPPNELQASFAVQIAQVQGIVGKLSEFDRQSDDTSASLIQRAFRGEL